MQSEPNYLDLAKMIDHALLLPIQTQSQMQVGLELAKRYDVASVCILPYALPWCVESLAGTTVQPSTVIGFPHGGQLTSTKMFEAEQAIQSGCAELDCVVNISRVVSGDWQAVQAEVRDLTQLIHDAGRKIKVIFETCYLSESQIVQLCEICGELNVDWVKTSTGFGTDGATPRTVTIMRHASPAHVQVKAAGGVRSIDDVLTYRILGASRVGTSRSFDLLDEWRQRLNLSPVTRDSQPSDRPSGY